MKYIYLLITFLVTAPFANSQRATDPEIRRELTDWDPVRGPWLAESMQAVANNEAIPDRTFPEQFTPSEMFSQVPADRQTMIRGRIQQNQQNSTPLDRPTWDRMDRFASRPSCNLTMGRSYGDPHIRTFDGKSFSFQTVGEFVLAKSSDGNMEVQARQKPQTDEVSLNTALAMNVAGDRVAIYAMDAPDGNNDAPLRVNGQTIFLQNEMFYLPRGGTIEDKGRNYIITWPTGEKVETSFGTSGRMRFMNVSVHVFPCASLFMGVLGNANGNPNDDFGDRGEMLASSTIFDPFGTRPISRGNSTMEREHLSYIAKDFARYHRVTNMTTLFDYGFGLSTWNYVDESFPRIHITLADLSENDRMNAQRRCEQQGISREDMAGCIFDVGHVNIDPTPRPVIVDRTAGGRPLPPVDGRTPNINRPTITSATRETIESNRPSNPKPIGSISEERNPGTETIAPTPQTITQPNGKVSSAEKETIEPSAVPSGSKTSVEEVKKPETEVVRPSTKEREVETRPVQTKPVEVKPTPSAPAPVPENKPSRTIFSKDKGSSRGSSPSSTPASPKPASQPNGNQKSTPATSPSRGSSGTVGKPR